MAAGERRPCAVLHSPDAVLSALILGLPPGLFRRAINFFLTKLG